MSREPYPPPIEQLLTFEEVQAGPWPNYLELGLGPEHVPDLIRLATSYSYSVDDSDEPVEAAVWMAAIHAWRALGQLGAEAATEPLLGLVAAWPHDEWVTEEMPAVFSLIGPSVIPALVAFLADGEQETFSRIAAAEGLTQLAERDPASREACVAALADQLARGDEEITVNSFIVTMLIRLKAAEAGPAIEHAFAANRIDQSIPGDWEDVQVDLGLLAERLTPRPRYHSFPDVRVVTDDQGTPHVRRIKPGYRPAQPAVTKTPKTKRRPAKAPGRGNQGKRKR